MDVAIVNVTPFVLALLAPTLGKKIQRMILPWGLAAVLTIPFVLLLRHVGALHDGAALEYTVPWVPDLGLNLSLYLDGLSLLFGLVVIGIGILIVIYAGYYFEDFAHLTKFYGLLFLFMGGMIGLILAGNLLMLFICWETTSIVSFFLISFNGTNAQARQGALQALIVTGAGGLALLVGLILLGTATNSMSLSAILSSGEALHDHPYYVPAAILIFVGCFSKSAQFPLHFWLPDAMTAPTPASAFLHSATMVKAGIYLLLRLYPALGNTLFWQVTLTAVGLTTMLWGAVAALRHRDLKACLAYSTISQLGALVALIGLPESEGIKAAMVGIVGHALYKAALFMVAGIIDHATGTRHIDALGGLAKKLPAVAVVTIFAALSMAGIPPMLGFVAKESMLEAMLHSPYATASLIIVVISAALTVAMALILIWDVFFTPSKLEAHRISHPHHHRHVDHHDHDHHHDHPIPAGMIIAPAILAAGSLLAALNLQGFIAPLLVPTVGESAAELALWNGFNTPLMISMFAIAAGIGVFATRQTWMRWQVSMLPSGRVAFNNVVSAVEHVADLVLTTQGGKIRYYLTAILAAVSLLMGTVGLQHVLSQSITIDLSGSADGLKLALLIVALAATIASVFIKNHLVAALILGVSGYCIGGIFLLEPAPDVALVQFLVETIGTVLVITMLGRIRTEERQIVVANLWKQTSRGIGRDIFISVIVGVGVALFSLAAVVNRPERDTITKWHIEHSEPDVAIDDIVASIVTDFRGMDTVIEITVFGMAALGVLTLLSTPEPGQTWQFSVNRVLQQLRSRGLIQRDTQFTADKESADPEIQKEVSKLRRPALLATPLVRRVATLAVPFSFLIAISHLLYGGSAPGDGFTAGVVCGLGVALWYVVFGYDEAKRRLGWMHPAQLIGVGFGLAILNAVLPLLFGKPFLATTQFEWLHLPAGIHIQSTTIFETGIFLAVLGGSSVILETIAHPGEVETL